MLGGAAFGDQNVSLLVGAGHFLDCRGVPSFQVADSWLCVFNHSFYSTEIFNERVEFTFSSLQVFREYYGRFVNVFC